MNRQILVVGFFAAAAVALGAQQTTQNNPYEGVSHPPSDDAIITSEAPQPKPPAGHPAESTTTAAAPAQHQTAPQSVPMQMRAANGVQYRPGDGTDDGIVVVAPSAMDMSAPVLAERASAPDPDGDIVHPAPLGRGELDEGATIRVRLLDYLSSSMSEKGQAFRSRVASDVIEGGNVVIPAGSEIDGRVAEVSSGHFGGQGTMMLVPDKVILPDGSVFQLHAVVTQTPGTNANVKAEGVIEPGSTLKHDSLLYGGVVGGGAVTGAFLGGPIGALAGGLVGAGVVTTHLLVSHPQVHLEPGSVLILTLSERMHLVPGNSRGE
jgi:hypothetical protein